MECLYGGRGRTVRILETLLVAVSAYSALPVPQFSWNEKNMRYAICCFPVVGLLCGGALLLWNWVCRSLQVSAILFAAVAACLPLLITGGIHMDGYMDTVDALASHQTRERKLEIMKDSACGAFAVLYCGVYLLLHFGLVSAVYEAGNVAAYAPVYVLSRSLSALCAMTIPNARKAGMLCAFTENTQKNRAVAAMVPVAVLAAAGLVLLDVVCGLLAVMGSILAALCYRRMAMKQFGGATGDTAGFFLQVCELAALAGVWVGGLL